MKKRTISFAVLAFALLATYTLVDFIIEPPPSRLPASVPNNYESMKACEKQAVLWGKIKETVHGVYPAYRSLGPLQLLAMSKQEVATKGKHHEDFAPEGWKKYLHSRASIATVKIVPTGNKYTGVFQGADCALLRLSLTSAVTGSRPVAPGLALKVLRDGTPSSNVSALVSLDGQGKDFNFFKNPMSNIVPIGGQIGQKLVHKIFLSASNYPEELLSSELATTDVHGVAIKDAVSPRQIFFVPNPDLKSASESHEVREDFAKIPEGTLIYKIYAVPEKYRDFDYGQYTPEKVPEILKEAEPVADIVTTSVFIASEFGDDGIFFRHQLRY